MVSINLFPWREKERIYHAQVLKRILGGTFSVTTLVLACCYYLLLQTVHRSEGLLLDLSQQLAPFTQNTPITDTNLMQGLQQLQKWRSANNEIKQFLFALNQMNWQQGCLMQITRGKEGVILSGKTRSAFDLSTYLRNSSAYALFAEVKVEKLQRVAHGIVFRIRAIEKRE